MSQIHGFKRTIISWKNRTTHATAIQPHWEAKRKNVLTDKKALQRFGLEPLHGRQILLTSYLKQYKSFKKKQVKKKIQIAGDVTSDIISTQNSKNVFIMMLIVNQVSICDGVSDMCMLCTCSWACVCVRGVGVCVCVNIHICYPVL